MDAAVVLAFFAAALVCYVHSPSILTGCVLGVAAYWSGTGQGAKCFLRHVIIGALNASYVMS